jgi:hypothetical protein
MNIIQELAVRYSRRRFACLFFSLVVTLTAAPVLAALGYSTAFMEGVLAINIVGAVLLTLVGSRVSIGLGLLALVIATRVAYMLFGHGSLLMTSQGGGAVTCMLAMLIMLRYILSEGEVTSERIFAALNVYLMMGVVCGLFFVIFEEQWPGSLSIQSPSLPSSKQIQLAQIIYFSFVTLGTLGYGDIIPVGGPARALAVMEAIGGQVYLVVVVARLVSLYQRRDDGDGRDSGQ